MQKLLEASNFVLFFSLPFKPAGKVSFFFNGHIACALDGIVYQIVNPYLLKTDFLFSIMPVSSWLFGSAGKWIERDPASPAYRHVYLYRKNESTRTVIYGAGLRRSIADIAAIKDRFLDEDRRFREGATKYDFFRYNCSSIIADALRKSGLAARTPFNAIPSCFFRNFVQKNRAAVTVAALSAFDQTRFSVRRFCLGLPGDPQRSMVNWAASFPAG